MKDFLYDRKKKKYVLNKVISADTETSHIDDKYCWIYETGLYDGDQFYIGRKPTDFLNDLKKIKTKYELNEKCYAIIYFHNLSYDISYLLPWILSVYKDTEVFAITNRKILTVRFGCFELRCSYLLSNMSLASWCDKLQCEYKKKKGLIDYDIVRFCDSELDSNDIEYFKYDLLSLHECVTKQLDLYNDTLASIPLTSTGYERRKCRNACNTYEFRQIFEKTRLTPNTYRLCRQAFAGGYTHLNRFYRNKLLKSEKNRKIEHRDMKSFYPSSQMLCYYPIGAFSKVIKKATKLEDLMQYFENYCCLARIYIENGMLKDGVSAPYLQSSKIFGGEHKKYDNGRVLGFNGIAETVVTELDLEIILKQYEYDFIIVKDLYVAERGELPEEFKQPILEAFQYKESLDKESELYMKSKNLLNGIYGMTATDIVRDLFKLMEDRSLKKKKADVLDSLNKYYKSRNNFMPYQWGVWCTAHCRNILLNLIEKIGYVNFIYCDTDSIFYFETEENKKVVDNFNNNVISLNIEKGYNIINRDGEHSYFMLFEDEKDNIQNFKSLHSKCYALINGKGELVCTIAGVTATNGQPKESDKYITREEELQDIDNLETDFTFVECGGTKSKYIHIDPQVLNINGHEVEVGDGVIISKTTKTLKPLKKSECYEIYERN